MRTIAWAGVLCGALAGCQTVGPDYALPDSAAVNRADLQGALVDDDASVSARPLPEGWWQLYRDPRLDALVQRALTANIDLRVAAANLSRARAGVDEALAAGGFTHSADVNIQRIQESGQAFLLEEKVPVANIGSVGLSTSYQFDLFGTLKRGVEAASASAEAARAAADVARITVVADTVRAYTQICAANEELRIAEQGLDLQQQSLDLTRRLQQAGRGNETEVSRSDARFKSLRAELPGFEASRQAGLYRLAMLLAEPVERLPTNVIECAELPTLDRPVPVGDGAALLARRPDVRRAERELAAATARIGVATGALYPDISIGATVGSVGILEDLGHPSTNRWGFGPLISWTVPSNGARARIAAAEASTQGALARFDGVVLDALRETRTRLAQYRAALQRRAALSEAEASARQAAQQTRQLYQAGRESFIADLDATRVLTDLQAQRAAAESAVALAQVDLFLALGGGWEYAQDQRISSRGE